jgi:GNAT superfamily N-acetyltransferase
MGAVQVAGAISLRPGTAEDAAACAAIFNAWVDAEPWVPRVHAEDAVVRHYREHVFAVDAVTVAERDGAVLGFLALAPGRVEQLYVAAAARGTGVGTALLDGAKAASPGGLTLWTFLANDRARRFYRRAGFVELRRTGGDNEEGLPDVLLGWRPDNG